MLVALAIAFSIYLVIEIRRLPATDKLRGGPTASCWAGRSATSGIGRSHGYVVDFALAHYGNHYFPAFNVADSAISIGAVLWIASMLRDSRRERAARTT